MHSFKVRFIVFFTLFILISCTVVTILASIGIAKTGEIIAIQQGYPVCERAIEAIDPDKFSQFLKDSSSMLVIELGIVTDVNPQPKNAFSPILVTDSGITMVVIFTQFSNVSSSIPIIEFGIVIDFNSTQPENAPLPIFLIEFGKINDFKPLQSLNADHPIEIIELGSLTDVRLSQLKNAS